MRAHYKRRTDGRSQTPRFIVHMRFFVCVSCLVGSLMRMMMVLPHFYQFGYYVWIIILWFHKCTCERNSTTAVAAMDGWNSVEKMIEKSINDATSFTVGRVARAHPSENLFVWFSARAIQMERHKRPSGSTTYEIITAFSCRKYSCLCSGWQNCLSKKKRKKIEWKIRRRLAFDRKLNTIQYSNNGEKNSDIWSSRIESE